MLTNIKYVLFFGGVQSLSWEDSPGEGKGYPLRYSGLENSMDCPCGRKEPDMTEWFFTFTFHYHLAGMMLKGNIFVNLGSAPWPILDNTDIY